jgi:hypothetical protein
MLAQTARVGQPFFSGLEDFFKQMPDQSAQRGGALDLIASFECACQSSSLQQLRQPSKITASTDLLRCIKEE